MYQHSQSIALILLLQSIIFLSTSINGPNQLVQAKRFPFLPTSSLSSKSSTSSKNRNYYSTDDDDDEHFEESSSSILGLGREFNIFGKRGGDTTSSSGGATPTSGQFPTTGYYNRKRKTTTRRNNNYYPSSSSSLPSSPSSKKKSMFSSMKEWINNGNLPKIQCRVEPNTTLKVRKTFRPLKTIIRLGADFNTQLGVWQFKSSWEDDVIGGKLTLAGREVQFSKTWLLSVGAVEDLVTRLRLRAAVDLGTMKAYARLGFRTERLSPINVVEGFTMVKRLPLDGNYGHVKLEVKANFAFPEPEIEYSTENHRSFVGMGDIEINIDELNLLLDY